MAVTKTIQDQVTELYVGFFGRAPDAAGMGYWAEKLGAGTATVYSIANEFSKTPEFVSNYGALTPSEQIDKIYVNVLDRKPDADGKAYWLSELTKGTPIGNVVYNIVNAAFSQSGTADGLLVQNKVTVGEYFSLVLASNDTAVAKTAYVGVTSVASSVTAKEAELAQAVAPTYTLTTSIETVPASGVLPAFAKVTGVVNGVNSTFQTGDSINGSANDTLNLTETANNGVTAAQLSNIATINHTNISGGVITLDETLYTNVGRENVVKGVAGSALVLTGANAATTFGVSSAVADALNVSFGTATGVTANLALNGAGASNVLRHVTTLGAGTQVTGVNVATSGNNYVNLASGGASLRTVTITGNGVNNLNIANGSTSTTAAVVIDASAATANQVIDLGTNASAGGITVKGTTDASTTTLGLVIGGAITLPTITNVEALQIDAGSVGTLISANSSITTVTVQNGVVGLNTLTGLTGVNAIQFQTLGGQVNNFGALTTAANGATTISFAKQNAAAIAAGNTLTVGALTLNGATSLAIDTANGVGATTAATFGGINSNTLTSLTVTDASTGLFTSGVINTRNAAGTAGTLSSLNLSGVAGTANTQIGATGNAAANQVLAANAVITGATLGSVINFGTNQAVNFSVNLTGNNTLNAALSLDGVTTQAGNITVIAGDVAGNVNTINTGAGADLIQLGLGTNTVNTGAGTDVVTINTLSTALNTFNVTVTGGTVSYTGLNADAIAINAAAITTTQNLGAGHTASTITTASTGVVTLNNLNGDTVVITGAGTVTQGAHTAGTAFQSNGVTVTAINGVISADTFALTNVAANSVLTAVNGTGGSTYTLTGDAGANTFTVTSFNTLGGTNTINYATADNGAFTIGATSTSNLAIVGAGTFAQTITDLGNGHTIDLGTGRTTNASTVNLTANSANTTTYDTLTNLTGNGSGTLGMDDIIDFAGLGANTTTVNNTGNVYASVAAGVAAILAGSTTQYRVYTFNVGTDTVAYASAGATGGVTANVNDTIVMLTGTHTLQTSGGANGQVVILS